ncbi:hypothetical protein Mchl_5662 (plasmid) [Methylorubrum extorquens CM4]|uniref:Prokaryotic YEATS domain-containing protein n=2 Tax=Methylorubrum extorquens TaxID=408 RepID=B7L3H7_METC4|nr:hypothetical protein Mchl_5662 [Methylorubrum extorquens CM4]
MGEKASYFVENANFDALVAAMNGSPKPLALIGAGASIPSGYPSWDGLVKGLGELVVARIQNVAGRRGGQIPPKYESFLKGQDPAWQAEEYRRMIGRTAFNAYIRETFRARSHVAEPYHLIAKLCFLHYLTTNFDPCIASALRAAGKPNKVIDWHEIDALNSFICDIANGDGRQYVVHLHGRHVEPGKVVLTESSYVERYLATDDTRLKLLAVFMTHPVVFIGFSMTDPDLTQLMREVTARLRRTPPRHFAILGAESTEEEIGTASRMIGKFGVQPVFYRTIKLDQERYDHGGLLELLHRVGVRTGLDVASRSAEMVIRTAPASMSAYDSDPNKGRFGGSPEQNGRRLRLVSSRVVEREEWMSLTLAVERVGDAPPLEGSVRLYMHPTFPEDEYDVKVTGGTARDTVLSTGAFTVGAVADGGRTRLELDLAQENSLPPWFIGR